MYFQEEAERAAEEAKNKKSKKKEVCKLPKLTALCTCMQLTGFVVRAEG